MAECAHFLCALDRRDVVSWAMTSPRNTHALLRELAALAPTVLFGSLSTTYRTCGKASCACHVDESRRHGPYTHVSYREDGKTRSYNVPADQKERVEAGIAAWERVQQIGRELAEHNRRELGLGPSKKRAR
jgi:hypothetical protein